MDFQVPHPPLLEVLCQIPLSLLRTRHRSYYYPMLWLLPGTTSEARPWSASWTTTAGMRFMAGQRLYLVQRRPEPAFYEEAAGPVPDASCPPGECQLDHAAPSQALYQTAPSVPRTKTSITPLAGDVAAGDEVSPAPRDFQSDHDEPDHVFWYGRRPYLAQRRRDDPCPMNTAGLVPEAASPPRPFQFDQELPEWSSYTKWRCRCHGQRRRSYRSPVTSHRVTR